MWLRRLPPTHSGAACSVTVLARWCSTQSGRGPEGKESSSKETTTTEGKSGGLSLTNTNSSVRKRVDFCNHRMMLCWSTLDTHWSVKDVTKGPRQSYGNGIRRIRRFYQRESKIFYDYTDDIPKHVKPFWHHEYYQQREYFRLQREKRPLREQLKTWGIVVACLSVAGAALTLIRVWVEQPREIRELREELLQQTYGKVLELAAGHGQNIGAYPYAVHEVIMCDSNAQQLQALRYRLPRTSYPKYDVRRVRSENLDIFADGEFDCVVDMFGLCHLHDPVKALRQMQRVVKPSGLILLLEHGSSPYPPVNWFLSYFEQRHKVNTHGCKWNLPIREFLRESRLEVKELRNMHYGTTYYVVAYPEVLEAFKDRGAASASALATA
ncbi:hypothetical protein C3747_926g3 [Trypanosoma cruzi]|uniref:Methyltransferase type 11 domain-containing protein n=1 Tax=Trypanosoma cruzi TaxID=5693 RepID=A0A2V2UK99_TRYCR|nr:hypothetical protein C3747_926g3 [Trypanosoma cruzi]